MKKEYVKISFLNKIIIILILIIIVIVLILSERTDVKVTKSTKIKSSFKNESPRNLKYISIDNKKKKLLNFSNDVPKNFSNQMIQGINTNTNSIKYLS
ncbi:MAG: hypothetical protein Q8807_02060 ['Waltheria sp.' little leaf phytoplasma]|nr:hypothetical protein ['Waltheria sp.' little leaf phytoplasma]